MEISPATAGDHYFRHRQEWRHQGSRALARQPSTSTSTYGYIPSTFSSAQTKLKHALTNAQVLSLSQSSSYITVTPDSTSLLQSATRGFNHLFSNSNNAIVAKEHFTGTDGFFHIPGPGVCVPLEAGLTAEVRRFSFLSLPFSPLLMLIRPQRQKGLLTEATCFHAL